MYDYENAMYNHAGKYYSKIKSSIDHKEYDVFMLPILQLSIECYLKNILEIINKESQFKTCTKQNKIPSHALKYLYYKIYSVNKNTIAGKALPTGYNYNLADSLDSTFNDFQASRFPIDKLSKERYKGKTITSEDLQDDLQTLEDT